MTVPASERGTALLTVLLLVAVMATVAATLLDRVGVATTLASNVRSAGQARAWLTTGEALALTRIEDLLAAQPDRLTGQGEWIGTPRTIPLPGGGAVVGRVLDGGNCFNLNALVRTVDQKVLATRPDGVTEFVALMTALRFPEGRARQIAERAADYIDDDDLPQKDGAERGAYPSGALPANRMMADSSELRAVPGVSAEDWSRLSPWLCALPVSGGSPVNVNTLQPDQAPLLVALSKGALDIGRARAVIARRPPAGFASAGEAVPVEGEASGQAAGPGVKTRFFRLEMRVAGNSGDALDHEMTSLIESTADFSRVVARRWGSEG